MKKIADEKFDKYGYIRNLCSSINYTGNTTDRFLFTVYCTDYFYFEKNIGPENIRNGFTDGSNDGEIDFVYNDSEKISLIQGKTQKDLNYKSFSEIFHRMKETYENIKNNNYRNYDNDMVPNLSNAIKSHSSPPIVELVIFTETILTENLKSDIDEIQKKYPNYLLKVYGKLEIEERIVSVEQHFVKIDEWEFELKPSKLKQSPNFLLYNDDAIIVTIKATSLKNLYKEKHNRGLFGYNLRDIIPEGKVDPAIDETINERSKKFWYLNNGITIGCSDFEIKGQHVIVKNFSIINGAQTTCRIGKSRNTKNLQECDVVCKIVKSPNSLKDDFIKQIAVASNSQKPIQRRDIYANSYEQQLLQINSRQSEYPLAIEIKRGVDPVNKKNVHPWQRISNLKLGQLILSCEYQEPSVARSQTATIFNDDDTYNKLFDKEIVRRYNYNNLFAIVKLEDCFKKFKSFYTKELQDKIDKAISMKAKQKQIDIKNILVNSEFFALALLFVLYKTYNQGIDQKHLSEQSLTENLSINFDESDIIKKINQIYLYIIESLYEIYAKSGATQPSNFLKSKSDYEETIIPQFIAKCNDKKNAAKIHSYLKIFKSQN